MKFAEHIKKLRGEFRMPQRQLAAALEIDTATYCKIEKGERRAKGEQVILIAEMLHTNKEELLALWLADQVPASVPNKKGVADKALNIAKQNINK
jgi:DNA-binding XRE family transcriptional regulator